MLCSAVGPNVNTKDYCIASKLASVLYIVLLCVIIMYYSYVLTCAVIYVEMHVSIEYYNIDRSQESIRN